MHPLFQCARRDSNAHASRHQILSLARLPITPRAQCFWVSECKGRQKNRTTKLLSQIYPKRYTERLPKAFLAKNTITQEQAKITIAENGMRRGAGM